MNLSWLPTRPEWDAELSAARQLPPREAAAQLIALAQAQLDFVQTSRLDRAIGQHEEEVRALLTRDRPTRLAILGSSTFNHLVAGIRVAAARRGMWVEIFLGHYGSYYQELADPSSEIYSFKPDVVLLALDADHVVAAEDHEPGRTLDLLHSCWQLAKEQLGAAVIQQTVMPVFHPLLGNNEHHHAGSPLTVISRMNQQLRSMAAAEQTALLAVDALSHVEGVNAWFGQELWHRFKQEVHPRVSHLYGEQVARLLTSLRGLSYKCLVLDLDNTLWGGVIGDDGLDGIHLGRGHAVGEAFTSFQRYAKRLGERGVILAVCSKNEASAARLPFEKHPEMVLRSSDISCFVANWNDKVSNIRTIASTLNIGLDSIVFADDNPFERNLVRRELPMVAVPEMPEDPALYVSVLAAAGYFEAITLTREDAERNKQYAANAQRERVRESSTDIREYLRSLNMKLLWSSFNADDLSRIVQLINKSNQFNLTTRRYTYEEVRALAESEAVLTLQLRLVDAFGDNGLIGVVIGRIGDRSMEIDTWLMSCRVLGRQIEQATLNLIVEEALRLGVESVEGVYLPTAKNGMVAQHYEKLGFAKMSEDTGGASTWRLSLATYQPQETFAVAVHNSQVAAGGERDTREYLQSA